MSLRAIRMLLVLGVLPVFAFAQQNALRLTEKVAARVMADTRFEWEWKPQQEVLGMQVIDARFLQLPQHSFFRAERSALLSRDGELRLGISSANAVRVYINDQLVYQQGAEENKTPVEIAYDHFHFAHEFTTVQSAGALQLRVESAADKQPVLFLRAITAAGYLDSAFHPAEGGWIYTGPLPALSGIALTPLAPGVVKAYAPARQLPELVVPASAAYQRDPYADWQYSHGILLWTIGRLGELNGEGKFLDFVNRYTDFTMAQLPYFRWQYDSLFAFRGSYHRVFRRTMLDDAGAPALPFAWVNARQHDAAKRKLLDSILAYVRYQQPRLSDGTFCRPEPVTYTVWCDDLFMSVPLLLQWAAITGDATLYDDAAAQAVHFQHYLFNPANGLYAHGWFSTTQQRSPISWGRANGWIAWATAELLAQLPGTHPQYKTILRNFRNFMKALLKYQAPDGMWHQVLDNPASYEETSCTAMFSLAMAKGVRMGWLDKKYKAAALRGWEAVAAHITEDGVVKGICRGTDMGYDEKFYMDRKTIDNDPRGLGAVIMAGIEISKLK